jgi:hypothetical protein
MRSENGSCVAAAANSKAAFEAAQASASFEGSSCPYRSRYFAPFGTFVTFVSSIGWL